MLAAGEKYGETGWAGGGAYGQGQHTGGGAYCDRVGAWRRPGGFESQDGGHIEGGGPCFEAQYWLQEHDGRRVGEQ